jgi:hypothetical protein
MSENTENAALRRMGYDTKADVCGHGFRAMACSAWWGLTCGLHPQGGARPQSDAPDATRVRYQRAP